MATIILSRAGNGAPFLLDLARVRWIRPVTPDEAAIHPAARTAIGLDDSSAEAVFFVREEYGIVAVALAS